MRALHEIKTEMASLMEATYEKKRERTAAQKRIQFLKLAATYIDGTPDEHFITIEISRLEKRVNLIIDSYDEERYMGVKDPKKKYEEEMGLPLIRLQLKALRYIKK